MDYKKYLKQVSDSVLSIDSCFSEIERAGKLIASGIREDRLVHVFGSDMKTSALITEIFFRPGSLINIDPMLDPTLDIAHGAYRNAMCLDVENLAPCILDYYEYVEPGDCFIVMGSDPSLGMFRQSLEWAKKKGLKTIAIAFEGVDKSDVDVFIPVKDKCIETYTAQVSVILNLLMRQAASCLDDADKGTWSGEWSVDLEGCREKIDKVLFRIRHI